MSDALTFVPLGAAGLHGLLVGSAQRSDLDPTASGAGLVDLRGAAQLEVFADPAVVSFGTATGDASGIERVIRIHNISTRRLAISIGNVPIAPKGVEITTDTERVRLRPELHVDRRIVPLERGRE